MTQQNGSENSVNLKEPSEQVLEAVEMAGMIIPQLMGTYPKEKFTWRSMLGGLPGLKKFAHGVPGRPRSKMKKATFSGRQPPQIQQFLSKFGAIRYDTLDWDTLEIMRRNPMVKLASIVRAAPIFTALREARVKCEDPNIKAFVEQVFVDKWLLRLADTTILSSYYYGSSPHEKVWQLEDVDVRFVPEGETGQEEEIAFSGPALVYKSIDFVHPRTLEGYRLKPDGSFNGFVQEPQRGGPPTLITPEKAFVYSNRFNFGGFWGEAETEDSYASWYYSSFFRALLADYVRLRAIPPIIGFAPWGTREGPDGEDVDNIQTAGEVLLEAFVSQVVILPYEPDQLGNNQWGYQELQTAERVDAIFTRAIEELEVNILRGWLVPERTVTQNAAAVGSYNQAEIHQERFLDMTKVETDNFLLAINKWIIPQLIQDNFGADAPPCTIFVSAVSERLKEKLFNIVISLIQNDTPENLVVRHFAIQELLKFLDIPFRVPDAEELEPKEEPTPAASSGNGKN